MPFFMYGILFSKYCEYMNKLLITAGSTGALLWAKQIIEHLGVFQSNTLES